MAFDAIASYAFVNGVVVAKDAAGIVLQTYAMYPFTPNSFTYVGTVSGLTYTSVGPVNVASIDMPGALALGWTQIQSNSFSSNLPSLSTSNRYLKPSRTGIRLYSGVSGAQVTNASSFGYVSGTAPNIVFSTMCDLETDFDQIALVFGNNSTTNTVSIGPVTLAVGGNASDTTNNTGFSSGVSLTFGGAITTTIGIATQSNGASGFLPTLLVSDFVSISSVDRTDIVGARPLLYTRVNFTPASATTQITTQKFVGSDFGSGSGAGIYGRWNLAVFAGTAAPVTTGTWPGSAAITQWYSPPLGILYKSRYGRVLSYVAFGDSITAGAGTNTGMSWAEKASQYFMVNSSGGSLTAKAPYPVESSKMAVSGTHNTDFDISYNTLVAAGILPNVVVYSSYTPNSLGNITAWQQGTANTLAKCDNNFQYPIVWTGLPTGPSFVTNSLANDQIRLKYNNQLLQADAHVVDMSTALTDFVNLQSTGAYQMIASYTAGAATSPGLHPNNLGDTQMATTFSTQALVPLTQMYYGGKTT